MTTEQAPADRDAHATGGTVSGERGPATIDRRYSVEARTSTFLAVGLMSTLGVGILTWYYATQMSRAQPPRRNGALAVAHASQDDASLPPLGRIDPPAPWRPVVTAPEISLPPSSSEWRDPGAARSEYSKVVPGPSSIVEKTPQQVEIERRLSGAVFSPTAGPASREHPPRAVASGVAITDTTGGGEESLAELLRPQVVTTIQAKVLPTQRLLLPKGAFIDCTLETAIDSTLPGMTTCVVSTDTFSADGTVVLLERGTKLVGETRGQVQQNSARVFVLWNEARTPAGVVIALTSPGTDELGRSGLPGEVNRHFFARFGAAILISTIEGAVQSATRSSGSGTIIYNPSTVQDVMTEVLKGTINIPPTVVKHQGDRIQVLVARDLDFRPVYELRSHGTSR